MFTSFGGASRYQRICGGGRLEVRPFACSMAKDAILTMRHLSRITAIDLVLASDCLYGLPGKPVLFK